MATGNFYKKNASNYFVILNTEEDEQLDHFLVEDMINDLRIELTCRFNGCAISGTIDRNVRSSPLTGLSSYQRRINFGGMYAYIQVSMGYRPGYYVAANLDWTIQVELDNGMAWAEHDEYFDDPEREEWIEEAMRAYSDWNAGLCKIHTPRIAGEIESAIEDEIEKIEKAFRELSQEYKMAYRFSNGETGYSKV